MTDERTSKDYTKEIERKRLREHDIKTVNRNEEGRHGKDKAASHMQKKCQGLKNSSHDTDQVNSNQKISQELGIKSIFYDPDWNPDGKAPLGYKNIPYNKRTFTRKSAGATPELAGLTDIPIPVRQIEPLGIKGYSEKKN